MSREVIRSFSSGIGRVGPVIENDVLPVAIALDGILLTTSPSPDVEPYHSRQVAVLPPEDWAARINLTKPEKELLRPLPEGSLEVHPSAREATETQDGYAATTRPTAGAPKADVK